MTPLPEIETYFKNNPPHLTGVLIDNGCRVIHPQRCVDSKIEILKANPGNRDYLFLFIQLHRYYTLHFKGVAEPPIEELDYKRIREQLKS